MMSDRIDYRPDLWYRVSRVLADENLKVLTVRQVAKALREPLRDVRECLVLADRIGYIKMPKERTRRETYDLEWDVVDHPFNENPIRLKRDGPSPKEKALPACPECGRIIRRRHGRRGFHDPNQCKIDNIKGIMNG